jgi:hypothetical protein
MSLWVVFVMDNHGGWNLRHGYTETGQMLLTAYNSLQDCEASLVGNTVVPYTAGFQKCQRIEVPAPPVPGETTE